VQQVTRAANVTTAIASSAQREPSMEEILASIRRIIEDSDSNRRPAGEATDLRHEPEPVQDVMPEVEAFRAELRADPQPGPAGLAVSSQADDAPWEEAAAVRAPEATRPTITLAEIGNRIAEESRHDIGATAYDAANEAVEVEPTPDEPGLEYESTASAAEAPAALQEAAPALPDAPVQAPPARPALVSEHTSRQVAAAFEELSEAFASRSRKTFDEMAEEMLRPMLQDWLDNNLPTLVERLVREEIERVARGAGA